MFIFFTELLGLCFRDKGDPQWFKMHLADSVALLATKGLFCPEIPGPLAHNFYCKNYGRYLKSW